MQFLIVDAGHMEDFGIALSKVVQPGKLIYVSGELGAGKTTLIRGVLKGCGHTGTVKSPTFTIVESYLLGVHHFFHFDLYRLQTPDELESLGFRDYLNASDYCFVEWPERGAGLLPQPDIDISIEHADSERLVKIHSVDAIDLAPLESYI